MTGRRSVSTPDRRKRLGVFRLFLEVNSFSPDKCDQRMFAQVEWNRGVEATHIHEGANTSPGAILRFIDRHPDWEPVFFRFAAGTPCGDITAELFASLRDELLADLRTAACDALYLCLHGASTVEGGRSAELDLLRAIRAEFPDLPIGASFDMHANLDPEIASLITVGSGYKTHPHVDMRQVTAKVLRLLMAAVRGDVSPTGAIAKLPLLLPSANMRTLDGPMREAVAHAALLEQQEGALDITLFGGFPYADCTMSGACCMVFTDDDPALARRLAEAAAGRLWSLKQEFFTALPSTREALDLRVPSATRPVALVDHADNPGSGGIGDTPSQLRELLDRQGTGRTVFCFLHDPDLVRRCHEAGIGARFTAQLGGRRTAAYGAPVVREIEVVNLVADCTFRNEGPQFTGMQVSYGATAVVRSGPVEIILTSICQAVSDPGFFKSNGISLDDIDLLAIKAKNHFRAAFAAIFATIIDVDEPGPAAHDFTRLTFEHVPSGYYPFDRTASPCRAMTQPKSA